MNPNDLLVPYIPIGDRAFEDIKGKQFEIWSTKQEQAFLQFKNKDSLSYKLCNLAKNDLGVLTLFFLKYNTSTSPMEEFPLELKLPIFVDVNKEFLKDVLDGKYSERIEELERKVDKMVDEYADLNARFFGKLIAIIMADPKFKQSFHRQKIRRMGKDEFYSWLADISARHKEEIKSFYEDLENVVSRNYLTLEQYIPVIEAYKSVKNAKTNMETLHEVFKENDIEKVLSESISKLITHRIMRMQLISICLECMLRKQLEPLYINEKYPGIPKFLKQCNKCNGKTIFHEILLQIPGSLTPLILENRIQEFMIGFVLADMEITKKVYIHKKIHRIRGSKKLSGVEVDIFLVTKNDEIVLVEVTRSDDLNNIMNNVESKVSNFEPLEYDYLFYVTGHHYKKYLPYGKNVFVFGIKHLPKLKEHIQYVMKKRK